MIRPLTCPICEKPLPIGDDDGARFLPFCSARCRQVDLLRWCQGKYAIVDPLRPDMFEEEMLDEP